MGTNNDYIDMRKNEDSLIIAAEHKNKNNNEFHNPPTTVKDEDYIQISNKKKQVPVKRNIMDAVRYSVSPGENRENRGENHDNDDVYTEVIFKERHTDTLPILNTQQTNTKHASISIFLLALILLLAIPVIYLIVQIQGQNKTLVIYEGKIKLLEEKLLTSAVQSNNCGANCSTSVNKLNESLETLAQITFAHINIDSNITSSDNRTALHLAVKEGQMDRVKFLLSHGASLEVKDTSGFTPLHLAALFKHVDVLNFLLDKGALVDEVNFLQKTALFFAIRNGCLVCVQILIERGANIYHRDIYSDDPMTFAKKNHQVGITEFLQQYMGRQQLPTTTN